MPRGRPKTAPPSATNRIYHLRNLAGLTQEQLAEKVGCEPSTIQKLEAGKRKLTEDKVLEIADALGVHPGELFRPIVIPDMPELRVLQAMTPRQRQALLAFAEATAEPLLLEDKRPA